MFGWLPTFSNFCLLKLFNDWGNQNPGWLEEDYPHCIMRLVNELVNHVMLVRDMAQSTLVSITVRPESERWVFFLSSQSRWNGELEFCNSSTHKIIQVI